MRRTFVPAVPIVVHSVAFLDDGTFLRESFPVIGVAVVDDDSDGSVLTEYSAIIVGGDGIVEADTGDPLWDADNFAWETTYAGRDPDWDALQERAKRKAAAAAEKKNARRRDRGVG